MHGARHQWECLEWLVAFTRLVCGARVDSATLIDRARSNGSARALAVALRLASDLLGAPLPSPLGAMASGRPTRARAAAMIRGIDRAIETGENSRAEPYPLNLSMMDGLADRAKYLALSVFAPTPREWELVRLPDALLFLYFPVRIARVIARSIGRVLARR